MSSRLLCVLLLGALGCNARRNAEDLSPDGGSAQVPAPDGGNSEQPGPDEDRCAVPTAVPQRCLSSGWCAEAGEGGESVATLWADSQCGIWTSGGTGHLLHWNGARWRYVPFGTEARILAVWGTGPQDVWGVGEAGTIVHWDGARLAVVREGGPELRAVTGLGSEVWAAGAEGTLLHREGGTWNPIETGTSRTLHAVWATSPQDLWIGGSDRTSGGQGSVYEGTLRHWNGQGWTEHIGSDEGVSALWSAGPGHLWAVGEGGLVKRWEGNAWTTERVGTGECCGSEHWWAVWGTGPDDVYFAGPGAVIHWNGTARERLDPPSGPGTFRPRAVARSAQGLFFGADGRSMAKLPSPWNPDTVATLGTPHGDPFPIRVAAPGPDRLYAMTEDPSTVPIFVREPGGWQSVGESPLVSWTFSVASNGNLYQGNGRDYAARVGEAWVRAERSFNVVTLWSAPWGESFALEGGQGRLPYEGTLVRWSDADVTASTWVMSESQTLPVAGFAIDGTGPSDIWVAGAQFIAIDEQPAAAHWNGTEWQPHLLPLFGDAPGSLRISAISAAAPDAAWVVGPRGYLARWNGDVWTLEPEHPMGVRELSAVHAESSSSAWAVGSGGIIHWDGERWNAQASGTDRQLLGIARAGGNLWVWGPGVLLRRALPAGD